MKEELLTWILGIASALFGGLNVFQWITLRSYKRVKAAEADKSEIDALRSIIEEMRTQISGLNTRVQEAEQRASENANKYLALYEDYYKLKGEFEQYKIDHR